MTDDCPTEISRTRLEVSFTEPPHVLTVYHPSERASIVSEITETGRVWVQSVEDGPRDSLIPMSNVSTVVFWKMGTTT